MRRTRVGVLVCGILASSSAGAETPDPGTLLVPAIVAGEVSEPGPAPFIESSLPIPEPPPDPPATRVFAAPASDLAGIAARTIARRVAHFRSFRAEIPGAVWSVDPQATWAIRSSQACLSALEKASVRASVIERELTTPVPTLVHIDEPIGGVSFLSAHNDRTIEISCELAARLPGLAKLLRAQGVRSVLVNSSYRDQPKVSFHTFGMALDIAAFETREHGLLVVAKHFEQSPDARTCEAKPVTPEGAALLRLACAIAESHLFSSVLTPNYNAGHRDHFHLDIRPDDPRFFVR